MRLLLDAHVSRLGVGAPLRSSGHHVIGLGEERQFDGLADEEVLTLALEDARILVTFDVAHFPQILQEWAAAGRSHSGVILVHGIDHSEFGLVVGGIERWLARRPVHDDWIDFPAVLDRAFATSS